MKTLTKITFLLFFILNLNAQDSHSVFELNLGATPEVVAIHDVELLAGTDPNEFEKYVLNNIAPIYNKMKGQQFILAKGDRGIRTNLYAFIITFRSIEDRNRIYPPSGDLVGDFGEDAIWDKLNSMAKVFFSHTDYVEVKHQKKRY
ncbi:MAG: hypothetical protein KJN66_05175 [Bacteroidia bacterium]|nr:hypothetical protein [Bacteroidia bacterium]